jgi:hypothetical protein
MSSQDEGAEELKAIAKYQTFIAIFSERIIQIEFVDSDPGTTSSARRWRTPAPPARAR